MSCLLSGRTVLRPHCPTMTSIRSLEATSARWRGSGPRRKLKASFWSAPCSHEGSHTYAAWFMRRCSNRSICTSMNSAGGAVAGVSPSGASVQGSQPRSSASRRAGSNGLSGTGCETVSFLSLNMATAVMEESPLILTGLLTRKQAGNTRARSWHAECWLGVQSAVGVKETPSGSRFDIS
jgi:hypothetical protein